MKKLVFLIIAIMFLFSTAYAAEIDLSSMSLAELIKLQQRVTMAMWETEEWQEVTVPAGTYEIGKDIPAGYWTIMPSDGKTSNVRWGKRIDDSGSVDYAYPYLLANEQITSPTDSFSKYNNVESVSWNLSKGEYITISRSSVVFMPFVGHNLGFK